MAGSLGDCDRKIGSTALRKKKFQPEIAEPSRAILHMFQICFSPEIRKRLQRQDIDLNFHLNAAQMLQKPAGGSVVRLNDEVRGIALLKIDREVSKGDSIPQSDLRNMEHFDLIESELDCGHFTMFWVETGWFSCFDFRSGRAKCMSMLEAASEFLTAARLAADNGLPRPSIDSLFSSCELISKVHLILYRNNAANSKSHSAVSSAINLWGKLGNIDQAFLSAFNRVSQLRYSARYEVNSTVNSPPRDDFNNVDRELVELKERMRRRLPDTKSDDV